jgi:hypothetical protein
VVALVIVPLLTSLVGRAVARRSPKKTKRNLAVSARTILAHVVLQLLAEGPPVPTQEALQLRNSAVTPEDAMLPLRDIASRILRGEENHNRSLAEKTYRRQRYTDHSCRESRTRRLQAPSGSRAGSSVARRDSRPLTCFYRASLNSATPKLTRAA